MPERLWNMLKLVPGISASRKSSLITGLARIDENTDELILSVYHLPEPTEFLDDKKATYYAWYYNQETEAWGKIGELQARNNLTYSLKKRGVSDGSGIFITVEATGREPLNPGEVIISSDPELFYKNLGEVKSVEFGTFKTQPIIDDVRSAITDEDTLEVSVDEIPDEERVEPDYDLAMEKDELAMNLNIDSMERDFEVTSWIEETIQPETVKIKPVTRVDEKPVMNKGIGERFAELSTELHLDDMVGMFKDNYAMVKHEVNLQHYWDKIKDYAADLYEDLELDGIYEDVKEDFEDLMKRIDFECFWNKVEDLAKDLVEISDLKGWVYKAKCWLDELDMEDWYRKTRAYVDAILEVVDIEKSWPKVKHWLVNLLESVDIDDAMVWVESKTHQMRDMNTHELKAEFVDLVRKFFNEVKMPEVQMAIAKVVVKEKVDRVGNFFREITNRVQLSGPADREQKSPISEMNRRPVAAAPVTANPTMTVNYGHTSNRKQLAYVNQNQPPFASPFMPAPKHPTQKAGYKGKNQQVHTAKPKPRPNYHSNMNNSYLYNPYIFLPTVDYSNGQKMNPETGHYGVQQPGYGYGHTNYYGCPCRQYMQYYQENFQVDKDVMGNPRYIYGEDDKYYFITPDGELVRKS